MDMCHGAGHHAIHIAGHHRTQVDKMALGSRVWVRSAKAQAKALARQDQWVASHNVTWQFLAMLLTLPIQCPP